MALGALAEQGVTVHGDDPWRAYAAAAGSTSRGHDVDWGDEYLSLDLAAAIVDSSTLPGAHPHLG